MTERRPLKLGLSTAGMTDSEDVRRFVKADTPLSAPSEVTTPTAETPIEPRSLRRNRKKPTGISPIGLVPITVRLNPQIAGALKRASLERQLAGETVFTQQDIVEQALKPWLQGNGYLE